MQNTVENIFSNFYSKELLNLDKRFAKDIEKKIDDISTLLILKQGLKRSVYIHQGSSICFDFYMDNQEKSLLITFYFLNKDQHSKDELYFDRLSVSSKNLFDLSKIKLKKNNSGFYMQNETRISTLSAEAALEIIEELIIMV